MCFKILHWILSFEFIIVILHRKPRDGAVVARWAHNPKVAGSSPAPATKEGCFSGILYFY